MSVTGSPTALGRFQSERGVSLILVGLSVLALTSLSALVLDYGIMWVGRRDAQNAADAGAIAGATAREFEEPVAAGPLTVAAAQNAATANKVFGLTTTPQVDATSPCPAWAGGGPSCVRVDVYNDGEFSSSTLPVYFATLLGQSSQSVKATATAWVAAANFAQCLMPWMIPDKFNDVNGNGQFDLGTDSYLGPPPAPGVYYPNPAGGYQTDPGVAPVYNGDLGTILTLKEGDPSGAISPSDYYEIGDSSTYRPAIEGCVVSNSIGDTVQSLPGNRVGPTTQAVQGLIDEDPSAYWDFTAEAVKGSSCGANCTSPRLRPVALFSPAAFAAQNRTSGRFPITITNIVGFFILSVGPSAWCPNPQLASPPPCSASTVAGVIAFKATTAGPNPSPAGPSTFLKVVQLIQ
jgi:hypothetical protein